MNKTSNLKLSFCTALFIALIISSTCFALLPVAQAAEPDINEETISILNNVVGLDAKEYNFQLEPSTGGQFLTLPEKEAGAYIFSSNGSLRASCSFVNNTLRLLYLSNYEGDLSVKETAVSTVNMAKGFLERYQSYTGSSFYGQLATMLNSIDGAKNTTKLSENIKLELRNSDDKIVDYVWTYVDDNGIVAKSKNIVLSYDQGQLNVFLNNWALYNVVGAPKLTSEEATAIAIETSRNFSYQVSPADNAEKTITGFKIAPESLGHAKLSYVNFPNASLARGNDPFTLYPSWYVPLGFDKFYPGDVAGMTRNLK